MMVILGCVCWLWCGCVMASYEIILGYGFWFLDGFCGGFGLGVMWCYDVVLLVSLMVVEGGGVMECGFLNLSFNCLFMVKRFFFFFFFFGDFGWIFRLLCCKFG